MRARVVLCGAISQYNGDRTASRDSEQVAPDLAPGTHGGFHRARLRRALRRGAVSPSVRSCTPVSLRHHEHVLQGLERAPEALNLLLSGGNSGKTLVEVDDERAAWLRRRPATTVRRDWWRVTIALFLSPWSPASRPSARWRHSTTWRATSVTTPPARHFRVSSGSRARISASVSRCCVLASLGALPLSSLADLWGRTKVLRRTLFVGLVITAAAVAQSVVTGSSFSASRWRVHCCRHVDARVRSSRSSSRAPEGASTVSSSSRRARASERGSPPSCTDSFEGRTPFAGSSLWRSCRSSSSDRCSIGCPSRRFAVRPRRSRAWAPFPRVGRPRRDRRRRPRLRDRRHLRPRQWLHLRLRRRCLQDPPRRRVALVVALSASHRSRRAAAQSLPRPSGSGGAGRSRSAPSRRR